MKKLSATQQLKIASTSTAVLVSAVQNLLQRDLYGEGLSESEVKDKAVELVSDLVANGALKIGNLKNYEPKENAESVVSLTKVSQLSKDVADQLATVESLSDTVKATTDHLKTHVEKTLELAVAEHKTATRPDPKKVAEILRQEVATVFEEFKRTSTPETLERIADTATDTVMETKTAGEVFGAKSCQYTIEGQAVDFSEMPAQVFGHNPDGTQDDDYIFPPEHLHQALISLSHGALPDNLWLAGQRGTGKTQFINNLGAKLGLNVVRINFSEGTDDSLIGGMTVKDGDVVWSDGIVSKNIVVAGSILLFDEVSLARPRQVMQLQAVVEVVKGRGLTIAETGEKIPVAPYVCFAVADNTTGLGDTSGNFAGTLEQNSAFVDRFNPCMIFDYLPVAKETELLVKRTGVDKEVAKQIVEFAHTARQKSAQGLLEQPPSIRQLMTMARSCKAGLPFEVAFRNSILNKYSEDSAGELLAIKESKIDPKLFQTNVPFKGV